MAVVSLLNEARPVRCVCVDRGTACLALMSVPADAGADTSSLASTLGLLQLALAGRLREEREPASPSWPKEQGDCCAAVGAEVYPSERVPAELEDWRLWLGRSSLRAFKGRDASYLCVRVLLAAAMDAVLAWSVYLFQQGHPGTLGWMIYRASLAGGGRPALTLLDSHPLDACCGVLLPLCLRAGRAGCSALTDTPGAAAATATLAASALDSARHRHAR